MATVGNNSNKDMAFLRDVFFESKGEREYNKELELDPTKNPMKNDIDFWCGGETGNGYYRLAASLIQQVESNPNIPEAQMIGIERTINYCLGKIEDVHPEQVHEYYAPDDEGMTP